MGLLPSIAILVGGPQSHSRDIYCMLITMCDGRESLARQQESAGLSPERWSAFTQVLIAIGCPSVAAAQVGNSSLRGMAAIVGGCNDVGWVRQNGLKVSPVAASEPGFPGSRNPHSGGGELMTPDAGESSEGDSV